MHQVTKAIRVMHKRLALGNIVHSLATTRGQPRSRADVNFHRTNQPLGNTSYIGSRVLMTLLAKQGSS